MINYLGNKYIVARDILANIPKADNFYDLFGGGGNMSRFALDFKHFFAPKWKNVHYNEIETPIANLFLWFKDTPIAELKKIIEELYLNPITREEFNALKEATKSRIETPIEALLFIVYAFGAKYRHSYIYGEESNKEEFPRILKITEHLKNTGAGIESFPELRLDFIHKEGYTSNDGEVMRAHSLARLENIWENIPLVKKLTSITNLDYREVEIKPNSVIYCDIPYITDWICYNAQFDHKAFYEWVRENKHPVYYSSFSNDTGGFKCLWKRGLIMGINRRFGTVSTECLFWNGK